MTLLREQDSGMAEVTPGNAQLGSVAYGLVLGSGSAPEPCSAGNWNHTPESARHALLSYHPAL